jgi:hypothetical protein
MFAFCHHRWIAIANEDQPNHEGQQGGADSFAIGGYCRGMRVICLWLLFFGSYV